MTVSASVATVTSHIISISLSPCVEQEITKVKCSSNSSIVIWSINNSSISAANSNELREAYSFSTVPDGSGLLLSTLVLNSSALTSGTSNNIIALRCCNEKRACKSIQLQYNGMCLDQLYSEAATSTNDRKSTTCYNVK